MYIPELLKPYQMRYETMQYTGLKVTALLADRVMTIHPITLEGLLSWAVVNEAETKAEEKINFLDNSDFAFIPIPLKILWKNENGLPLWASSYFTPAEDIQDVEYFHKRAPEGYRTKSKKPESFGVKSVTGRWADRRTPFPVIVTKRMEAFCIGNHEEIEWLLGYITHIGKKTAEGFGLIKEWKVEDVSISEMDCLVQQGKLARNIPAEFPGIALSTPTTLLGWTHPYWNPQLYGPGWTYGTEVR